MSITEKQLLRSLCDCYPCEGWDCRNCPFSEGVAVIFPDQLQAVLRQLNDYASNVALEYKRRKKLAPLPDG